MSPSDPNRTAATLAESRRSVIVLNHLFKNAGATFCWTLRQNFRRDFADYHKLKAEGVWSAEQATAFLGRFPTVKAVEIHHFRFGVLRHPEIDFHNVVFLRHPLDRLRSTYDFYHQHPPKEGPLIPIARQNDLRGFLMHLMEMDPHPHVESQQIRLLLALEHTPDESDLAQAIDMMRFAEVPGRVERFDDCAVLAEAALTPRFPGIDLSYVSQNVTAGRSGTLDQRMEQLAHRIGPDLYEHLLELNALDMKLLDAVDADINRRIAQLDNFNARRMDFQHRCRRKLEEWEKTNGQTQTAGPLAGAKALGRRLFGRNSLF